MGKTRVRKIYALNTKREIRRYTPNFACPLGPLGAQVQMPSAPKHTHPHTRRLPFITKKGTRLPHFPPKEELSSSSPLPPPSVHPPAAPPLPHAGGGAKRGAGAAAGGGGRRRAAPSVFFLPRFSNWAFSCDPASPFIFLFFLFYFFSLTHAFSSSSCVRSSVFFCVFFFFFSQFITPPLSHAPCSKRASPRAPSSRASSTP